MSESGIHMRETTMRRTRQIVRIDEEKCTGCGDCVTACAEGAIEITDGKARLISEIYCDGLGACLDCPEGAISMEEREAEAFDEEAVKRHLAEQWAQGGEARSPAGHGCASVGPGAAHACPSSQAVAFGELAPGPSEAANVPGALGEPAVPHWPLKLGLVPPGAPFLQDVDMVLIADCTAFAYPDLYRQHLGGRALAIGCPKFDDYGAALERLTAILQSSEIRSLTVVNMEVPCCFGYWRLAQQALEASGKTIPLKQIVVGIRGEVVEEEVMGIEG